MPTLSAPGVLSLPLRFKLELVVHLNPVVHGHVARVQERVVLVDGVDDPPQVRNVRQNERKKNLPAAEVLGVRDVLVALFLNVRNRLKVAEANLGVILKHHWPRIKKTVTAIFKPQLGHFSKSAPQRKKVLFEL